MRVLLLALAACAPESPPSALPGEASPTYSPPQAECDARWLPDDCTVGVASDQWVEWEGAVECSGGAQPGTTRLADHLMATFPGPSGYGIYSCREIQGGGALSLHAEGRAIDLMIPQDSSQPYGANNAIGDPVAAWLMEHAEEIGIQSFSWDRTIFYGDEEAPKNHCLSIENGHWDHLHIELSWDAALERTPWFNPPAESDSATFDANAPLPTVSTRGGVDGVVPLSPRRLFDTRQDTTSASLVRVDGGVSGPLGVGGANVWSDAEALPAGAEAAWLNVTAIGGSVEGYVAAAPADAGTPGTSTVNHTCRQPIRANGAPLGVVGPVAFWASQPIHAIADLSAVFAPSGEGVTLTDPARVFDSRETTALAAGEVRAVDVSCAALGADCTDGTEHGAIATVTVVATDGGGYLTAFPCGAATPDVSLVNYEAGAIVANATAVGLTDGQMCLYSSTAAHVLVDVTGVIGPDGGVGYQALAPTRLLDTRQAGGLYAGRTAAGQVLTVPVGGLSGVPAGVRGAVVNLTTVDADGTGYLTAYPCDAGGLPPVSAANWTRPDATAAVASAPVSATDGTLCVYTSGRTHVLVDLLGVWVDLPATPDDTGGDPGPGDSGAGDTGLDSGDDGPADTGSPGAASAEHGGGCGCATGGGAGSLLGVAAAMAAARRRRTTGR